MGTFNSWDNAFQTAQFLQCLHGLHICDRHVFYAAAVTQISMFRPHARIIQSCGNRMGKLHVAVFILQQIRFHAMQNANLADRHGAGMLSAFNSQPGSLHANQFHRRLLNKFRKHPNRVGTAAHTGHNHIRKPPFRLHQLAFCLLADYPLELLYHLGVRVRP